MATFTVKKATFKGALSAEVIFLRGPRCLICPPIGLGGEKGHAFI